MPSCCANPDPRILDSNGRMYCHSCRRYLSKGPADRPRLMVVREEPPEYEPPEEPEEEK